jgi:hypothetical protein
VCILGRDRTFARKADASLLPNSLIGAESPRFWASEPVKEKVVVFSLGAVSRGGVAGAEQRGTSGMSQARASMLNSPASRAADRGPDA